MKDIIIELKEKKLIKNQTDFAKKVCIDETTISNFCSGRRVPNFIQALDIFKAFPEYSTDYIMGISNEKLDKGSLIINALSTVFEAVTSTSIHYCNADGEEVNRELLLFALNPSVYEFLLEYIKVLDLHDKGLKSYKEEVNKIKDILCNNTEKETPIECLLIPSKPLFEVVEADNRLTRHLEAVISLSTVQMAMPDTDKSTPNSFRLKFTDNF